MEKTSIFGNQTVSVPLRARVGYKQAIKPVIRNTALPVFFVLAVIFTFSPAHSQTGDPLAETFYQEIYKFQFESAKHTLNHIKSSTRDPLIKEMLYISYEWWMLISTDIDRHHAEYLLDRIGKNIERLDQRIKSGKLMQNDLLQMIMLYSYQSRINNHLNDQIKGFLSFRASTEYFKLLSPCSNIGCDIYNLVAGLFYTLTGYLQKEYPAIYNMTFDEGFADIPKGISLLAKCENSVISQIRTESMYFFMKLYLEVEPKFETAEVYATQLIEQFPDNLVFRLNHLTILNNLGKDEELLEACRTFLELAENLPEISEKQRIYFIHECRSLMPAGQD